MATTAASYSVLRAATAKMILAAHSQDRGFLNRTSINDARVETMRQSSRQTADRVNKAAEASLVAIGAARIFDIMAAPGRRCGVIKSTGTCSSHENSPQQVRLSTRS